MDKLTAIAKPKTELDIEGIHTSADKLIELFKSQLDIKNIKISTVGSGYLKHKDDDNALVYLMHYKLYFIDSELPEYSLYLYASAETGDILIPFLGHYGNTRAITIFHNEEINNIQKVMVELTEALDKECMYDAQFNF